MNDYERQVHHALTDRGHIVLRNGWPDFLVLDRGRRHGYALELTRGADRLSQEQRAMHAALGLWGMQIRTIRPEAAAGLVRAKGKTLETPATQAALRDRLEELKVEAAIAAHNVNRCLHELRRYESELDAAIVIFDELSLTPVWHAGWDQHPDAGASELLQRSDRGGRRSVEHHR